MMKLQGLITATQSLFGSHRPTFGFVVLPFVGVVLFPSPAIYWSRVAPQSSHLMELGQGTRSEGETYLMLQVPFLMLYLSSPIIFFSFMLPLSLT